MASLIDEYRRHAVDYGVYTAEGDADGINESYDRLQHVFISLVSQGKGDELFRFYEDVDPWVQLAAAAHTLEIDEARASVKLDELNKSGIPHISTDARYTLEGWKAGDLRFLKP